MAEFLKCYIGDHEVENGLISLTNIFMEGKAIPFTCLEHAIHKNLWCDFHKTARQGFPPDGTACTYCIMLLQATHVRKGENYLLRAESELPKEVWEELVDYLDPQPEKPDMRHRVMYFTNLLAIRAVCRGTSMEDELSRFIEGRSIEIILPNPLKQKVIVQAVRAQ